MRVIEFIDNMRSKTDSVCARRLLSLFEYCIAAILIIQCNTVWMTIEPYREDINRILFIALFVCTLCCMILSGAVFSKKRILFATGCTGLLFLYLIILRFVPNSNRWVFWHCVLGLLMAVFYYLMCCDGEIPRVLLKYSRLVTFVAVYSLFMWILCSICRIIPPSGVVMTSWNDTSFLDTPINSYFGVYFETQYKSVAGVQLVRNTSIFTEAPMASLHFSLALLIESLLKKKCDGKTFIILALAILTTMATTGYLVLMFVALTLLFSWLSQKAFIGKKALKAVKLAVAAIGICVVAVILLLKIETVSGSIRFDDMCAGVKAFCDHPLLGNGFSNLLAIQKYMSHWRMYNVGFSSGLLWILSDGGIWLGLVHVLPIVMATYMGIKHKQTGVSLFAILIFAIFLITVFQYTLLLSFMLAFLATYQNSLFKKGSGE